MSAPEAKGPDPLPAEPDRALLRRALPLATALALALALGGLLPGTVGRVAAGALVAVLIAVPLLRVGILSVGWRHSPDRRFALAGVALLAVVGVGALIALAT